MKNKQLIFLLSFLLVGCATNTYNVPFVDSVETVMLTSGMSRSEVLKSMGQQPLYSEYGNEETREIFWVYEVRGRQVKSEVLPNGGSFPNKDHYITKATAPIHRLRLEFRDDKLYRWQPVSNIQEEAIVEQPSDNISNQSTSPKDTIYVLVMNDENKSNNISNNKPTARKKSKKKKKNTRKFFADAGLSVVVGDANFSSNIVIRDNYTRYYNFDCDGCYSMTLPGVNVFFGLGNQKGRFGLEYTALGETTAAYGIKKEWFNISPASLILSAGVVVTSIDMSSQNQTKSINSKLSKIEGDLDQYDYNNYISYLEDDGYEITDADYYITGTSAFKIGIGKQFNYRNINFIPKYELNLGENIFHSLSVSYKIR